MLSNSRHPSPSSIFWPVDDVDSQSTTVSSLVQPIIDAGKQRRSTSTVEALERQSFQTRPALGSLLIRRLNSASLSQIAPSKLLPEKYELPQTSQVVGRDNRSRSVSAPFRPKWTCSASTNKAMRKPISRSSSLTAVVDSRSDDGCTPWCRNNDENLRRNSVEFYGTMRRSSEPSAGLTKYPSASSLSTLGRNADRRRPWISKYLQQFVETDGGEQTPTPRRQGSVSSLVNSFEQCALQYGTIDRSPTTVPRGGLDRRTIHGSLTNLDSIGRTRGWSSSSDKAADDNSGSGITPPSARANLNSTNPPLFTSQPVPGLKSYGEYVKMWKTRNDHGTVDDGKASTARRSSVDVIRTALHGSLTNLDSIGRARGRYNSSEKVADGNSDSVTTLPNVRTDIASTKSPPLIGNGHAIVDDEDTNSIHRSSSADVITPAAVCNSNYIVSFKPKLGTPPLHPHQQRRLSVLVGTGRISNSYNAESIIEATPPTVGIRQEAPENLTGTVSQQETSDIYESGYESSQWIRNAASLLRADYEKTPGENRQKTSESCEVEGGSTRCVSRHDSESVPIADTHYSSTGNWVDKSLPSFAGTDNDPNFESAFWQYGSTSLSQTHRRTGSLVSDSNNTEDSGVSSSDYTSPVVDWSQSDQKATQNGEDWSRYKPKYGPWMTYRDDEDEKMSTTSYSTPPSQDHSDIKLTQFKAVSHGIYVLWFNDYSVMPRFIRERALRVAPCPSVRPSVYLSVVYLA